MVHGASSELFGKAAGLFRRPSLDDPAVGGKARSLARLASFGLTVPPAFAIVSTPAGPVIQAGGLSPPLTLRTPQDLAALDQAHAATLAGPFSPAFLHGLPLALAALVPPGDGEATFAVRSSSALEDNAQTMAPGVFDSVLRVPRDQVAEATRAVLASALTPAAWAYVLRAQSGDGAQARGPIAVLVHRFVEGDAHGAVMCDPGTGGAVDVDVQAGTLAADARTTIEIVARRVAAQAGPVELEWTAAGAAVTFLQLRPFHPGRLKRDGNVVATRAPVEPGWTWDAAHNPAPLTPAQAGLVDWVDARCTLGFRQRVAGGYLFYRAAQVPVSASGGPRALFERLEADVSADLIALGPAPRLRDALAVYTRGYQGLFGVVQPACAAARAALKDFLRQHAPSALDSWPALVGVVASAATRRRDAAAAIAGATDAGARAAAIEAYLQAFGDESGRWDVAEPTLRERPEALLFVGRARGVSPAETETTTPSSSAEPVEAVSWAEDQRAQFRALLAAAREASAVAEDDDALFARLQAMMRAALLTLAAPLVTAGRLNTVADVFFLPFDVTRALDEGGETPAELNALAASGRTAFSAAVDLPPGAPASSPAGARVVAGQRGAGGRAIGRVVLHPSPAAPGPSGPPVIVAATLLPTELPLLDAAALVVETGTSLGHVAAQARERGIPAVVAAPGARAAFRAGQLVLVDGDRGLVVALDDPAS